MPNLFVISFSFKKGGAAIAANNFCNLLKFNPEFRVNMVSQDQFILSHFIKRLVSFGLTKLQWSPNPVKHSLNLFSFKPVLNKINENKEAIFHFHWINNDTLSVFDLHQIPPNSLITLHDEWLFLGSEHYHNVQEYSEEYQFGYQNRRKGKLGINWNYLIWKIKYKALSKRSDLIYTVPSQWMSDRAQSSLILKNAKIRILPNPIDTEIFKPINSEEIGVFRKSLGISERDLVIAFGAIGGKKNQLKGASLLELAIKMLRKKLSPEIMSKLVFLSFGGKKESKTLEHGVKELAMAHISDQNQIALLYSASDILVVPSLVESFGQVAAESLACETPVVCFDTSGLRDIVLNSENGTVCFEKTSQSLSDGLCKMILMDSFERKKMGIKGREHVIQNFSTEVIKAKYLKLLLEVEQAKIVSI